MFESPTKLLLGLVVGVIFGFLLQKGRVAKYEVLVGQLRLRDWTVVKIMGTAVVVGSVGVAALAQAGLTTLAIKPMLVGGVVAGAVLFGAGLALLGYCPGTSVAAAGEGRRDAMVGILGMLFGALAFVAAYPALEPLMGLGDAGKKTFPQLTQTSPWAWIAALVVVFGSVVALELFGRGGRRRKREDAQEHLVQTHASYR